MEATQSNLGICSTCIYVDTCVRRASHDNPVWECNGFDNVPLELNKPKIVRSTNVPIENASETDSNKYLGLCKNCSSRKTCTHPKSPGGVWHCEDYE